MAEIAHLKNGTSQTKGYQMRKKFNKAKIFFYTAIKSEKAFTLIEMLVVLAISSIMLTAIITFFSNYTKSNTYHKVTVDVQHETRTPIEFMARSIRMAGLDPYTSAGAGILQGTANTLQLAFDLDNNAGTGESDGDITDNDENITYSWSGTAGDPLTYTDNTTGITELIAENVTNLTFAYFDSDNAPLAPLPLSPPSGASPSTDDIASIRISITVSAPAGRSNNVTRTVSNLVRCRNLNI